MSSGGGAGTYALADFKLGLSVQYVLGGVGLVALLHSRRRLRAARGLALDPFPHAVLRTWRGYASRARNQ